MDTPGCDPIFTENIEDDVTMIADDLVGMCGSLRYALDSASDRGELTSELCTHLSGAYGRAGLMCETIANRLVRDSATLDKQGNAPESTALSDTPTTTHE